MQGAGVDTGWPSPWRARVPSRVSLPPALDALSPASHLLPGSLMAELWVGAEGQTSSLSSA